MDLFFSFKELSIKLFIATMIQILNTLKGSLGIKSDIICTKVSSLYFLVY